MITVQVQRTGWVASPEKITPAIEKASAQFMQRQGKAFLQYANELTPVGQDWSQSGGFNLPSHPGLLAKSNQLRVLNAWSAEVVNTQSYAIFVAQGTSPHMPPASSGLPWPVRRAIGIHGTKAQPWYSQAFERGMQDIGGNLDQMANDIVREVGGG
jgi:hypothetical protein